MKKVLLWVFLGGIVAGIVGSNYAISIWNFRSRYRVENELYSMTAQVVNEWGEVKEKMEADVHKQITLLQQCQYHVDAIKRAQEYADPAMKVNLALVAENERLAKTLEAAKNSVKMLHEELDRTKVALNTSVKMLKDAIDSNNKDAEIAVKKLERLAAKISRQKEYINSLETYIEELEKRIPLKDAIDLPPSPVKTDWLSKLLETVL